MSTAPLTQTGGRLPGRPATRRLVAFSERLSAPSLTLSGLLVIVVYAAFAHGGVSPASSSRIELAVSAVAVLAGIALTWTGSLRISASTGAVTGTLLLGLFAAWSAVTVLWSVAPNQTWLALNRELSYLIVLVLAIALGSSHTRAIEWLCRGFLAVALLVTVYALGQKLLPGFHIPGVFDLNQAGPLPRLQEPLGYWNALALFVALAIPIGLAMAVDRSCGLRLRIGAAAVIAMMLLTVVLTYSRGGLLALAIGLAVGMALSGASLRWLMWLAAVALAAAPSAIFGLTFGDLTRAGVSLGHREVAGVLLLLILAVSLGALVMASRRLAGLESRIRVKPARQAQLRRRGLLAGMVAAACAVAVLAATGAGSDAWHSFTATRVTSDANPAHLLSADSQNRWVWWKEAARAFADRPAGGWGAGSFGVVHRLYRRDAIGVQQPHSVPLQFLSETGAVGALLALGAFLLLARAAWQVATAQRDPRQRLLSAALMAGVAAYGIHSLYDWDWDIPAVTLPGILFVGVLAGARGAGAAVPLGRPSIVPAQLRIGARGLALVGLTLWLCLFGLSAELPELAASKASHALVLASEPTASTLAVAQSAAVEATRLDPLSDAGLLVQADIAQHQGRMRAARGLLADAIGRDPTDLQAWEGLAFVDLELRDRRGLAQAERRLIELDPHGKLAGALAQLHR